MGPNTTTTACPQHLHVALNVNMENGGLPELFDPLLDFLRESQAPESAILEEHLPATKEAHALLRSAIASREKPYTDSCFVQASRFDGQPTQHGKEERIANIH